VRVVWLKRIISLILFAILLYFFWPLLGEVQTAAALFQRADWAWLVIAILVQVVSYAFLTWLNLLALQPFGGKIGFLTLAGVLTSMAFIQIALPSGGLSGVALRVRLLSRFGYKMEDAMFSLFVETFSEVFALSTVAFVGVVYLLQSDRLLLGELAWLLVALFAVLILAWYVWRILRDLERCRDVGRRMAGLWNRTAGRRFPVDPRHWETRLVNFRQNLVNYRRMPIWKFTLAAYGKVLLDIVTLGAGFYLVHYAIGLGTLLTGYGLILTLSGLAALPGGVGMADASTPVIFSWLNVPEAIALAAGLIYRLIAFWLLRFVGFACWQVLENRR